jgi:outer membrane receptor for monomeric catechols
LSSDGLFDSPQQLKRLNISAKYNFRISGKDEIALLSSFFKSGWYASGQIPDRAVRSGQVTRFGSIDDTEGGNTSRHNLSIRHSREFSRGRYLQQQVYGIHYNFALFSNFTFFLYDGLNGDQIYQRESRNVFGYNARYSAQRILFGRNVKTEGGGGFRYDDIDNIGLFNSTKRLVRTGKKFGNVNESNFFGHVSETMSLSEKWLINGALRVDHFSFIYDDLLHGRGQRSQKTLVSPKFNVTYSPTEKIAVYAKWGMGSTPTMHG